MLQTITHETLFTVRHPRKSHVKSLSNKCSHLVYYITAGIPDQSQSQLQSQIMSDQISSDHGLFMEQTCES